MLTLRVTRQEWTGKEQYAKRDTHGGFARQLTSLGDAVFESLFRGWVERVFNVTTVLSIVTLT